MTVRLEAELEAAAGDFRLGARFSATGRSTVLFGPSGSGKTLLLSLVAGARRPTAGRIVLDGRPLFDSERGVDVPMARRRIGWVSQSPRLFPHLSVEANLRYGLARAPVRRLGVEAVVAALRLEPLLGRRPATLSGGEAQRVALGRALLAQPELLLLDEPLAALDGARRLEALEVIETARDELGVPMLYVTHDIGEALRLGDRVVRILAGAVVAEGDPAAVLDPAGRRRPDRALPARLVGEGPGGLRLVEALGLVWRAAGEAPAEGFVLAVPEGAAVLVRGDLDPSGLGLPNLFAVEVLAADAGSGRLRIRLGTGELELPAPGFAARPGERLLAGFPLAETRAAPAGLG